LIIDRTAAETDLLVSEGFIEPHFFAGFSGGRKSVLPGICDQKTVLGNHCSNFIDSPYARTGILDDNPLQIDMEAAAKSAQLAFIVNVIIDESRKAVASFAGDPLKAHRQGCDHISKYCFVEAAPADIVVTTNGGAPLDQNIYQCVKGLTAAESAANRGAVLIMCAKCNDGTGSAELYRSLRDCKDPIELYKKIMDTPQDMTEPDQWEAQVLARILIKHKVIFVTRPELKQTILDMKMNYALDVREAMNKAYQMMGEHASVCVIPNGISVIVRNAPLL
jgi:nickel-dependent lactate racemase